MPNPPDAAALMMSARSFGNYDLPSAVADLVDNSLKARARVVYISCIRSDAGVEVRIRDDGEGMSADALAAAMRPASANPEHERSSDDLGRFGWGLKSASFSQCRKVTVVSNDGGGASGAEWDLDSIDGWCMGLLDDAELAALADPLVIGGAGTEVIWRDCDRLSENGTLGPEAFNALVVHARARLALLFHRFLAGEVRGRPLRIVLNGQPVAPFDPFHRDNNATQALAPEEVHLADGSMIAIRGYVLPCRFPLRSDPGVT